MNLKEDLDILDTKLNKLKVDYEQYFMKNLKREPVQLREEVDRIVLRYSNQPIQNTAMKFRYSTLTAKYTSLKHHWDRIIRQIEEGTFVHYTNNASQKPAIQKIEPIQQDMKKSIELQPLSDAGSGKDRFSALYQEYVETRKKCNESINGLTREKLMQPLLAQTEKIKNEYKCSDVEYKVSVKDGKTKLIIVPKK